MDRRSPGSGNFVADEIGEGVRVLPFTPEQERKLDDLVNVVYYTGLTATVWLFGAFVIARIKKYIRRRT